MRNIVKGRYRRLYGFWRLFFQSPSKSRFDSSFPVDIWHWHWKVHFWYLFQHSRSLSGAQRCYAFKRSSSWTNQSAERTCFHRWRWWSGKTWTSLDTFSNVFIWSPSFPLRSRLVWKEKSVFPNSQSKMSPLYNDISISIQFTSKPFKMSVYCKKCNKIFGFFLSIKGLIFQKVTSKSGFCKT